MIHLSSDTKKKVKYRVGENEIHVWSTTFAFNISKLNEYYNTLSQEEKQKLEKLKFRKYKAQYVISRGILRKILADYNDCKPSEVELSYTEFNKPYLQNNPFRFNISHSEDLIVFALTRENEIGIDCEYMASFPEMDLIAKSYFSSSEFLNYLTLSSEKKILGFYNCWTRKEAFIKAIGEGLSFPLKDFDVNLIPNEKPKIIQLKNDYEEAKKWSLKNLNINQNYVVSLAIRSKDLDIKTFLFY